MDEEVIKKKILFVDDEVNILRGLQRLLRSHRNEWDMVFVNSPQEALDRLAEEEFHIVVSDLRMPHINGAELLSKIQKLYPDTARFVLSGHADTDMILQSVSAAHQFLAKPCDADKLQEAITRALSLRDIFHSEVLLNIVRNASSIPALPDLYVQLTDVLASKDSCSESIAKIICQDVTMSAKILQLVNSSFFGLSRRVDDIVQAVGLLGAEMISNIILVAGVFGTFDESVIQKFEIRELQQRCLAVSHAAGKLVKAVKNDRKLVEEAMLAGMMHELGTLALINSGNETWEQLYLNRSKSTVPFHELEWEVLGVTHAEIGAYLLELWGLSNPVAEAVAFHHRPSKSRSMEFNSLTALHIADVVETRFKGDELHQPDFDHEYLKRIGIDDDIEKYIQYCAIEEPDKKDAT